MSNKSSKATDGKSRVSKESAASHASLLITDKTPFHVKEAYKNVRSNLLFTLATTNSKAFVVTSAMPSEGKSTTGANLAMVLAQTGAQVLLLDCDLRKPMIYLLFRLPIDKGVTSILCGIDKIEQALHQDVLPNLDIITSGPNSPNPSELLGSAQMSELLSIVQKAYDYVVIDTPPVNVVSDALLVAKQTAGLLLVARQEQTRHDQLRKTMESCEFATVNILGVVVNDVKTGGQGKYYKYRYGKYRYGAYRYGSKYEYKDEDGVTK